MTDPRCRRLALLASLALACPRPCPAAPPRRVAVVALTAADAALRLRLVERAVVKAAAGQGWAVLDQAAVRGCLRDPLLRAARRRAATLLAEATVLGQEVRYDEALRKLESAEAAAEEGLARLGEPALLAEIYFQRGIALLPTDQAAALRHLEQSLAIWPSRPVSRSVAPKIARALRSAAGRAALSTPTTPGPAEAGRACRAANAGFLLAVDWRQANGREVAYLFLFDLEQETWRPARAEWDPATPLSFIEARLRDAVQRLLPAPLPAGTARPGPASPPPPVLLPAHRRARAPAWVATAASAALAIAGTSLLALASGRARELEELGQQRPPLEYEPAGRKIEEAGRRFNTAGVVCLSVAGAAAVAALVLWLLPAGAEGSPARAESASPGTLRVRLDLP